MSTTFFSGDENGNIKRISVSPASEKELDPKRPTIIKSANYKIVHRGTAGVAVQQISLYENNGKFMLGASRSDGSAMVLDVSDAEESAPVLKEWSEPKFRPKCRYVGIDIRSQGIFTATSSGHFGLCSLPEASTSSHHHAVLPLRLRDFKVSESGSHFAYGGDEVDLSLWSVERTLSGQIHSPEKTGDKRKKSSLLYGEIWRARNVENDSLSLRQPINISSLAFLSTHSSGSHYQLAIGNMLGSVRIYDTRTKRQPVSNWNDISKAGGIRKIVKGSRNNELFAADSSSNLYCLDLRNGKMLYGYQGLAGSIDALASTSDEVSLLGSTALDRYFRVHSTVPLPSEAGGRLESKGNVIGTCYMKSTPTALTWAGSKMTTDVKEDEKERDDVWDEMESASDDEKGPARKKQRKE